MGLSHEDSIALCRERGTPSNAACVRTLESTASFSRADAIAACRRAPSAESVSP
jgi:hypothetical protein